MAEKEREAMVPENDTGAPEMRETAPARSGGREAARRRRSRRRWRGFIAVYSLLFLLAGAALCFVLYRYCAAYEASIPEHVMDRLMEETDEEQWLSRAREGAGLSVSEFENGDELFDAYCEAVFRGHPFTYRKYPGEYSVKTPVYAVRCAGRDLCRVELSPKGSGAAGFGRDLWQVREISSCFSMADMESVSVVIDAPEGAAVYVNGRMLSDAYLTGEKVPAPDLGTLEARFAQVPVFDRWRVEAMYGEITVTDENGRIQTPEPGGEDGTVHYLLRKDELYSLTVRAPENVLVSAGGVELDPAEAVKAEAGILKGLDAYTGGEAFRELTYSYSGLYTQPEVTARSADGAALTPLMNEKGELIFFLPQDDALKAETEPQVREFFDRYIAYSSRAYDAGRYNALLACILPGTDLYAYVHDSVDAMIWASATKVTYDELAFEDFRPVGEDCFVCTIRYKADFAATAWWTSYSYDLQNAYELAFVRQDGRWLAAAMSVISG